MNSFRGASSCARTALGASLGIDVIDIAFRDSAYGALVNTRTACNAVVANYISHFLRCFYNVSTE